jgi:glutathione synthase/RimK-type ligase-like ATP-grasp enzyme
MDGYVIVKPMATGYIERGPRGPDSLIYTNRVKVSDLADLADLSNCPTLFQEYVRKRYDIRVTVVDSRMHAVALSAQDENGTPRCDIRRNNMIDVRYETVDIPSDTAKKITNLLTHYGLRFAAIDFAASASGEWLFLEINPNGQWAWLEQSAGIPISDSFIESFST